MKNKFLPLLFLLLSAFALEVRSQLYFDLTTEQIADSMAINFPLYKIVTNDKPGWKNFYEPGPNVLDGPSYLFEVRPQSYLLGSQYICITFGMEADTCEVVSFAYSSNYLKEVTKSLKDNLKKIDKNTWWDKYDDYVFKLDFPTDQWSINVLVAKAVR